jgi:hypothetical protein
VKRLLNGSPLDWLVVAGMAVGLTPYLRQSLLKMTR